MEKFITTEEAAQILGVTAQRVRDLAREHAATGGAKGIQGEKLGRDWRVSLASVKEYKNRPETRGRKRQGV